jgi:hypothetical protein
MSNKNWLDWLVVWNMNFMAVHILGIIFPTDELIFFRGVETTNQLMSNKKAGCWYSRPD